MRVACEIEFIGGPIDGSVELMVLPLEPFLGVKSVPDVSPSGLLVRLMRLLGVHRRLPDVPLALYELTYGSEGLPRYQYCGTHAVRRELLRHGCGQSTLLQWFKEADSSRHRNVA